MNLAEVDKKLSDKYFYAKVIQSPEKAKTSCRV